MGLFDKIFNTDSNKDPQESKQVPWINLTEMDTLETIARESQEKPVVILKHSTRCGISRMVLRKFEQSYDLKEDKIKLYFLDLLSYREISNKIASKFNIPHESPQLIVIRNGKVVYDASHNEIEAEDLKSVS